MKKGTELQIKRGEKNTSKEIATAPHSLNTLSAPHLNHQIKMLESESGDIGLMSMTASVQSFSTLNSHHPLIAEWEVHQPHILLPAHYPVYVEPISQFDEEPEWVVSRQPIRRIGVGMEIIGVCERGENRRIEISGEVVKVERWERKYVVFAV